MQPTPARITQLPAEALRRCAAFWASPFFATQRGLALFWFLLAALCTARAFLGLAGMRAFSHDGFLVLDGAWRMVNGQRPHVDFNSMVGPVAYLPTVLGFWLSGNTAAGFGYGQAIAAFGLGAWAFALGSALAPATRTAFALCVAALAGSPALVGPSPFDLSPGMTYNRYTYALLGLLLLECVRGDTGAQGRGGVSSGVALGLMAFLKMTGLVIGAVLILSLVPVRRQTWSRWLGLAVGGLAAALPLLAYLHFQAGVVWRDLALTAAAKHMVFYDRFDFTSIFVEATFGVLITAMAIASFGDRERAARHLAWAVGVVLVASLGLILGNYQRASLPLLTLMLVVVIDVTIQHREDRQTRNGAGDMALLAVGGASIFIATLTLSLVTALLSQAALKVATVPHRPVFQAPGLASFVPVGEDIRYTHWVNDGFALLATQRRPGEHVMSLDFTNPFSLGLHIAPAPGGTTNLQFQGSFDDTHKLSPERLFGSSELVMLPRVFSDPSLEDSIARNYGTYLQQHYALAGHTDQWELYRRRR